MSAVEALKAARVAGVGIALDGSDLMLQASAPPPAAVLDALSRHKGDIIALLRMAPLNRLLHVEGTSGQPDRITATTATKCVPWAEWKAAALNRLFQGHGFTGLPARITAATIMHGMCFARPQIAIDSNLDFGKGTTRPMSCAGRTAE
jgi:hypothetical protein